MTKTLLGGLLLLQMTAAQGMICTIAEKIHGPRQNSSAYISALESSERDSYQKPEEVLEALQLKTGEVIADIGAGSGYFSFRLAREVGESGKVYAVDINPDMILHMNRRSREASIDNIVTILSDPDDPLLREDIVDRVFICNTWHHIDAQKKYLSLLRKSLKPNGQIIMIDFEKKELPVGPPLEMKIAKTSLISQMESAGFALLAEHHFLPYQYFLIFRSGPE
jgi:ubiquinone/menaquinone biosynthesis C-methylase UbiE